MSNTFVGGRGAVFMVAVVERLFLGCPVASDEPAPGSEDFPTVRGLSRDQRVGSGRYLLKQLLGQGGMGIVWLAWDDRLREDVALKFLPQQLRLDVCALDDLRQETLKSRKLAHPNIIRIHDLFEARDEDPFISMEYVDGPTLSVRRSKHPMRVLKWQDISGLMAQLCEALQYAHNEQVIHRDLKPANLMLNSRLQIKLADFGIARVVTDSVSRITMRQGTSGTLVYMSPQQLDGHPSNPTDDLYSVGATLFELLSSKPPFYTGEIAHQIRYVRPDTVSQRLERLRIASEVPPMVEDAVAACLEKDPAHRPQNARELSERFGLIEARPPSSRSRKRQKTASQTDDTAILQKRQLRLVVAGVAVVGLAMAAATWWRIGHQGAGTVADKETPAFTNTAPPVAIPVQPAPAPAPALIASNPAEPATVVAPLPKVPQTGRGWTNSLDMRFAPLPETAVLLSIWETRVKDYEAFVNGSGYKDNSEWKKSDVKLSATHPVANVNFEDGQQFCVWLTRMEQRKGVLLTNQCYRLPTDLEWSAAVGLENEQGRTPMQRSEGVPRRYPWGEAWPPPAGAGNFAGKEVTAKMAAMFIYGYEDAYARAAPVGSFTSTKDGFYDLAGNVEEWCSDFYDNDRKTMVLRGGSWNSADNVELLSSYRDYLGPLYRRPHVGFRCVLDPVKGAGAKN